jgi:hypothetical protein
MSAIELYTKITFGAFVLYSLLLTRAYLDQRSDLKYYKRHYDATPKTHKRVYKPSRYQRLVDAIITLSPIK